MPCLVQYSFSANFSIVRDDRVTACHAAVTGGEYFRVAKTKTLANCLVQIAQRLGLDRRHLERTAARSHLTLLGGHPFFEARDGAKEAGLSATERSEPLVE